jgi:hypothetical protein
VTTERNRQVGAMRGEHGPRQAQEGKIQIWPVTEGEVERVATSAGDRDLSRLQGRIVEMQARLNLARVAAYEGEQVSAALQAELNKKDIERANLHRQIELVRIERDLEITHLQNQVAEARGETGALRDRLFLVTQQLAEMRGAIEHVTLHRRPSFRILRKAGNSRLLMCVARRCVTQLRRVRSSLGRWGW